MRKPESVKNDREPEEAALEAVVVEREHHDQAERAQAVEPGLVLQSPLSHRRSVWQGRPLASGAAPLVQADLDLRDFVVVLEAHERAPAVARPQIQRLAA